MLLLLLRIMLSGLSDSELTLKPLTLTQMSVLISRDVIPLQSMLPFKIIIYIN